MSLKKNKYFVCKPFNFLGQDWVLGDTVEIPEDTAGSLGALIKPLAEITDLERAQLNKRREELGQPKENEEAVILSLKAENEALKQKCILLEGAQVKKDEEIKNLQTQLTEANNSLKTSTDTINTLSQKLHEQEEQFSKTLKADKETQKEKEVKADNKNKEAKTK